MQHHANAEIWLYPPQAIPRRVGDGLVIADTLGNMVGNGLSDSGSTLLPQSFTQLNPTVAIPWAATPYTLTVNNLLFARFLKNGRVIMGASAIEDESDLAGFYIAPRVAPLDCRIGSSGSVADGGRTDLNWDEVQGTWKTVARNKATGGTSILNLNSSGLAVARTRGTLPANRAFVADVYLMGFKASDDIIPEIRLQWGNGFALRLTDEQAPRLERLVSIYNPTTYETTSEWQWVKGFEGAAPINMRGGHYRIVVMRLAGRLVVEFAGRSYWFLDPNIQDGVVKPQMVNWIEAPVVLEASNARVRLEFAVVKWSQPNGAPFSGYITRAVKTGADLTGSAPAKGRCGGWIRNGTTGTISASPSAGQVSYTSTLTANLDGIDTPFLARIALRFAPSWVVPTRTPINVRDCCKKVTISLRTPPQTTGSEATIELDRTMLDKNHPGWENYAKMHNRITVTIQRMGGAYSQVFTGYIFKPFKSSSGGQRTITLTLRDPIVRLQKVGKIFNALIDHRYAPLDLLFAEGVTDYFSNGGIDPDTGNPKPLYKGLYIAECVKVILEIALGQQMADSLNGDGNALRFLPDDWPPLMTPGTDVGGWIFIESIGNNNPIAGGSWMLPPPFGSDVLSWINQLATRDHCVFYFGWPPGYEGELPVPIYGRLQNILAARDTPLHVLHDVKVGDDDYSRMLNSATVEERPERDLNCVTVWGAEEPGLEGLLPSLRISTTHFDASDPSAAWRSWERTLLIRDPFAFLGAEAIGEGVVQLLQGVEKKWPTFQFEGDERVNVGHVVEPHFTGDWADPSFGLEGIMFRAESVEHVIDFTGDSGKFTTSVRPRPLTALEKEAFERGHLV